MYPVEQVLYQEARHFALERVRPDSSILVLDTSALAYPQFGGDSIIQYLRAGGTVVLEQHVEAEINHHDQSTRQSSRRPGGSDTRDLPRIALNGRRLIDLIEERITDVTRLPEFEQEKTSIDTISKILPKVQAYQHLSARFPQLYDSLACISKFHTEHGVRLSVEDLRGRGKEGYERLHEIVSDDPRMGKVERADLAYITDTQHSFITNYARTVSETLGECAQAPLTLFSRRSSTIDHLKTEARHAMDAVLLRMLGYINDPDYTGHKENAIAQCHGRFRVDARSQEADAAVIMASYVPSHPHEKDVYLLSSDTDLRYGLRIRQVVSQRFGSPSRRLRAIPQ